MRTFIRVFPLDEGSNMLEKGLSGSRLDKKWASGTSVTVPFDLGFTSLSSMSRTGFLSTFVVITLMDFDKDKGDV